MIGLIETLLTATKPRRPKGAIPGFDELTDYQRERAGIAEAFIDRITSGASVQRAIAELQIDRTPAWGYWMQKQYRVRGRGAFVDARVLNSAHKYTNLHRALLLALYVDPDRSAMGPVNLHTELAKECAAWNIETPSVDWVVWYVREKIDDAVKLVRDGGWQLWLRSGAPVALAKRSTYANELWYMDHNVAPLWTRTYDTNGRPVATQLYLSAVLDDFSQVVPGFIVSARHWDAWTTALLFRTAVLPKDYPGYVEHGICDRVRPDNEAVFRAAPAQHALESLGTHADYAAPHSPNEKAPLERFFGTIKLGLFRTLPGYKGAHMRTQEAAQKHVDSLLEVPELRERITKWIVNVYHTREKVYLELGGITRSPASVWRALVRFRAAPDRRVLDVMLLQDTTERTVSGEGIKVTRDGRLYLYNAPELTPHIGDRVWLRTNPDDTESVLVYRVGDNLRIGEAFDQASASTAFRGRAIAKHRNAARVALEDRIGKYHTQIEIGDRPPKPAPPSSVIGTVVPPQQRPNAVDGSVGVSGASTPDDADVLSLLTAIRRRDREDGSAAGAL